MHPRADHHFADAPDEFRQGADSCFVILLFFRYDAVAL